MALLSLTQARQQCRLEPDEQTEDDYLQTLIAAATAYIARRLQCTFVDTRAALNAMDPKPDNAIVVEDAPDLVHAAALLVGHWFNAREAVSETSQSNVPLAFDMLIFEFSPISMG